ncbi:MAG: DegT/DnrJ/EryC1/StrS family aminotransferase [Bacteroidales bacterium]|jgi:dTDP-4-amino-4,6-dideoxygalactose transaminase|nr:DegT/DnrJ/EryC1/StrS family aminotransferase [Bacteroidales bacterium]
MRSKIFVTRSFLPPKEEYIQYISAIYERGILTNQGPLVLELEEKLRRFLGVNHLHYLCNGTVALQLALAALDINEGEVITTPFSYVATISAILWQRCTPVFVDIEPDTWTIDPTRIEAAITPKTKAIMAVHVFGYACAVDTIKAIAEKHNLKVIYDGAHVFGSRLNGKALIEWGDVSMLSFHATKLFHTIEGGACICNDKAISDKIELLKRFGHNYGDHQMLGINAKASEFHAAMGLVNLKYVHGIIEARRKISMLYDVLLDDFCIRPKPQNSFEYNYAYYPVLFQDETELLKMLKALNEEGIFPRRYFYPSLNTLPYVTGDPCPLSEDIARRILCLPLYVDLTEEEINTICSIIKENMA